MITGPLKAKVDKLWEEFWTGGITNPLTVIEQISFLAFARLLDIRESTEERKWRRTNPGRSFKGVFGLDEQELRWQNFAKLGGEAMLPLVRDKVFPHFRKLQRIQKRNIALPPLRQSAGGQFFPFCRPAGRAFIPIRRHSLQGLVNGPTEAFKGD